MTSSLLKSLQLFQKTSVVQGDRNLKLLNKDWKHRPIGELSGSITWLFGILVLLNLLSKVHLCFSSQIHSLKQKQSLGKPSWKLELLGVKAKCNSSASDAI